jgi:hypothetical protein
MAEGCESTDIPNNLLSFLLKFTLTKIWQTNVAKTSAKMNAKNLITKMWASILHLTCQIFGNHFCSSFSNICLPNLCQNKF